MTTFSKMEDIEVWKRSCRLAVEIYQYFSKSDLIKQRALNDHILKSVVSIPSNIAEGYERDSDAEFKRFLTIAKGSCGELRTQLYIVKAIKTTSDDSINGFIKECSEISSMLQGLIQHLKNSK